MIRGFVLLNEGIIMNKELKEALDELQRKAEAAIISLARLQKALEKERTVH